MLGRPSKIIKYLTLCFAILLSYQAVDAHDKAYETKEYYKSFKQDVTGDNKVDTVALKGKISKRNVKRIKSLKLTVKTNEYTISIPLKSGSHPKLEIEDFNADGVKDVLVTMKKHNRPLFSRIYSFKGEKVARIELPPLAPMTAQFQDNYIAEISVEGQETVSVDIRKHRNYYEKLGIYHNGKLNEAMELIVDPYSEFTVASHFGRNVELVGKQMVKGIDRHDAISTILTSWTFIDGKWKLKKIEGKPVKIK